MDLFAALADLTPQDGETRLSFRARLRESFEGEESKSGGALAAANLYRVRLGIELLAEQPPKGKDRLNWQRETAAALGFHGRGARIIRELLGVAEAVQEAKAAGLAHGVPIEVIHRRFGHVRKALRAFLTCGDPDGDARKAPQPNDRQQALAQIRLERAAEHAARLLGPDWLRGWLEAKQGQLQANPAWSPPTTYRKLFPSPLPYLGSKRRVLRGQLIPRLSRALSPGTTLVETHVGGGSVFLNALHLGLTDRVRINDKDPAVADFWTELIREPGLLRSMVETRTVTEATVVEYLQYLRDTAASLVSDTDRAERAYRKLVAHACTFASKGAVGRLPFPPNVERWNGTRVERSSWIRRAHALVRGRVVGDECTALDGLVVLAQAKAGEVVYLDPPYWSLQSSQTPRPQYVHGYTAADHAALRDGLRVATVPWLLTCGYPDDSDLGETESPAASEKRRGNGRVKWHTDLIPKLYADRELFRIEVAHLPSYSAGHKNSKGPPKGEVGPRELMIFPVGSSGVFEMGRGARA